VKTARTTKLQYETLEQLEVLHLPPITRVVTTPQQRPGLTPLQKVGYGALLFAFLFGGFQAIRCGVASGVKLEALVRQLSAVETVHADAVTNHAMLEDKISLYGSPQGIEEMARERLGLVGQDEILIRMYPAAVAQR
jgi:cell division protein FtsB